jgi:hypothetical protein
VPTAHVPRAFVAVAPLALGMVAATLALTLPGERSSQLSAFLAVLLIVAWEFVAIGLFMLARGRARWFGLLSVLTGFGLFVNSWRFSEVPLAYTVGLLFGLAYWGPFLHLVLAFPAGRVPERGLRWLIAATYAAVVLFHPLRFLFGRIRTG